MIPYHLTHGPLGCNDRRNTRGNFHVSNEGMITTPLQPLDSRPFRYESVSAYDSSGGRRTSGGWLSDGELRNFNVAQVNRMTAMNNGRWAGSYDEPYYQDRGDRLVPFGESRDMKPTEKISVPEFSGEGANDTEVGKSARSYIRKVQVWLRCTRLPHDQRALALYSALAKGLGLCRRAAGHHEHREWCWLFLGVDSDPLHGGWDVKDLTDDEWPF